MSTEPPVSKVTLIRDAHARGEGGYGTLAKRFGISLQTVKYYIQQCTAEKAAFQQCGRKVGYDTADAASQKLSEITDESQPFREVYQCARCHKFHFGRPTVNGQ